MSVLFLVGVGGGWGWGGGRGQNLAKLCKACVGVRFYACITDGNLLISNPLCISVQLLVRDPNELLGSEFLFVIGLFTKQLNISYCDEWFSLTVHVSGSPAYLQPETIHE